MDFSPQEIKNLRLKLMMTQTEFAKLVGVSFLSINRYENGKSKPTFKVQRKLTELRRKVEKQ